MRNNQPVTNREVYMKDGSAIVSRTDLNGRILAVNQDFLDIAGYTKEETIGQPHNFIRHPDMPQEAFADMWRDLKDGKAWSGYVKNRTKNGDHYWVQANAMPVSENGQVNGYISVRRKPDSAITREVETIYRKFREGAADGMEILHGQALSTSSKARLKRWLSRINSKVMLTTSALCLMIILVGGIGVYVSRSITESLRTVYEDRTVPTGQLQNIEELNYESLIEIYRSIVEKGDHAAAIKKIEDNTAEVEKIWEAYMATYLTPEEKVLAAAYAEKKSQLKEELYKPAVALLKVNNYSELEALLAKDHALIDETGAANSKLIELQMNVAGDEYKLGKENSIAGMWLSVAAIVAGVVVSLFGLKLLRKGLNSRLSYLDSRLSSIVGGNYATEIEIGHDELQSTLTTARALQAKLAYGELEKADAEREKIALQEKLANDFEQSVKGIVNMVAAAATELSQTSDSMVKTVMESSQKTSEATSASTTTASNVQAVAAAAEELSASVREISSQIQKTTQLVSQSQQKTKSADDVAAELARASERVTTAMQLISGIASQINLLALNATIESARAGEAGKGFAVVASEVKNLAGQTDKTVNEIQTVVDEMRNASQSIIGALAEIGSSVSAITEASASVASAVEEQSAVTNEIARNMQNASSGTQTITHNLQEVMAAATHSGAASEQMLIATRDLSTQAENLNSQVDSFLSRIRQAS